MKDFKRRLATYTPQQRTLLEQLLCQKGSTQASHDALTLPEQGAEAATALLPARMREPSAAHIACKGIDFSLFYFSSEGYTTETEKYHFLLETARFADEHGFHAVWLPERHLQAFGGLYPNPSLLAAALAVRTRQIRLYAGSVVAPLHHPVRIAEEWSIVDNLSQGRAGISFATGWHPGDFVLRPENYPQRRTCMIENLDVVRRLWRGECVTMPGGDQQPVEVRLAPRPIQAELPCWITTSGSSQTWSKAGEVGANVLASLIGQSIPELEARITLYRDARASHGLDPLGGRVTLMMHMFLDEDPVLVRETVRAPLYRYLETFLAQLERLAARENSELTRDVEEALAEVTKEELLSFSFERYFQTASLLGTPEKCAAMVERLSKVGVDEIACLIDFGPDLATTLQSLSHLARLKQAITGTSGPGEAV